MKPTEMDSYVKDMIDMERRNKRYNSCMDALTKVYNRWWGSAQSLTHAQVDRMCKLVGSGKTSIRRYCHELNDKIFFNMYKSHLYKDCEGKDVTNYCL